MNLENSKEHRETAAAAGRLKRVVMPRIIKRLNAKYDRLEEPYRFLVCLAVAVPGIFAVAAPINEVSLCGAIYVLILASLRLMCLKA